MPLARESRCQCSQRVLMMLVINADVLAPFHVYAPFPYKAIHVPLASHVLSMEVHIGESLYFGTTSAIAEFLTYLQFIQEDQMLLVQSLPKCSTIAVQWVASKSHILAPPSSNGNVMFFQAISFLFPQKNL